VHGKLSHLWREGVESAVMLQETVGRKVNGLRVQELKVALASSGVPVSEHAQTKAAKLSQLKHVLSSTRASQGPFGALEDGRLIDSLSIEDLKSFIVARGGDSSLPPWDGVNLQNSLPSELQRLVRSATGCPPLTIPVTIVEQPRGLRSPARAEAAAAAHHVGLAPPVFGMTGQVLPPGQVLSPGQLLSPGQVLSPTTATTAVPALPTPSPHAATTVVPPVTPLLPPPQTTPPVVPPAVHFENLPGSPQPCPTQVNPLTATADQHGRSDLTIYMVPPAQATPTWSSHPTLSICETFKSSTASMYPFVTSNPSVVICHMSVLFNFLSGCPGLLNSDGIISYMKLHVVLAGQCSPNELASSAGFGSTLTLDYLNTLAEALAPSLLSSRVPHSLADAVNIILEASAKLRMPLVIRETDLILPEPAGPCDAGLSTLLTLGTGKGTTQKFWIASCLVGGVGLSAGRFQATNSALRYLDQDTFYRLVPEYVKQLTAVNLATLMLVWNSFMTFQHLPTPRVPTSLQQLVSAASDDIALRLRDPDVFSCYMSETIEHMYPPPVYLRRLLTNVQPYDVPTVVTDLKTFIFSDSLQDKPNSIPLLRAIDASLSSFTHLIPEIDPDGVVVLSLYDALARIHVLKDRQRSRADFGSARSSSSSSDPSGLPSGGAFARQFADSIAMVQHILDDIQTNANDFNQQERVVKMSFRKRDLSQFGLPSSSVFSSVTLATPRQATSTQPLTSALKRKAQDYRGAESRPGHSSSDRRPKTSSSSLSSALKSNVMDSSDQLVTRSPRKFVVRSPSSPLSPSLPFFADCESGRVAHWSRDYILVALSSRTSKNKILRFKNCQTLIFCPFSSPRNLVKPTFLDMFLNMRLTQQNVLFGNGFTKTNTGNTGRKAAGFSLGGEESTILVALNKVKPSQHY
jgi:hypothetical protein